MCCTGCKKSKNSGYNSRLDTNWVTCDVKLLMMHDNGGIAQLGERLHGMQEVSSSILLTSTNFVSRREKMFRGFVKQAKKHRFQGY